MAMMKDNIKWSSADPNVDYGDLYNSFKNSYRGKMFLTTVKKVPVAASIILTGGTFAATAGLGRGLAIMDLGFGIDDLTANADGQTAITQNLSDTQKAAYSSFRGAFSMYGKYKASLNLAESGGDAMSFVQWTNANYQMVDGALQAKKDVDQARSTE